MSDYPAVSVLLPTTPVVRLASRDGELLDRLVKQAAARLIAELPPERAEPIVTRLRCLVLEAQSGPSAQGLALYASGGVSALRRLPIVVDSPGRGGHDVRHP